MQGTPGKTRARPRLLTLGSLFCFMGIQRSMSMVFLQKSFPKELMLLQPLKNIFIYFIRKCIFTSGFIHNLHFDFACNLHFCLPFYFKWKAIAIKEQSKDIQFYKTQKQIPMQTNTFYPFLQCKELLRHQTHYPTSGFKGHTSWRFQWLRIHFLWFQSDSQWSHCLRKQYTPSQAPFKSPPGKRSHFMPDPLMRHEGAALLIESLHAAPWGLWCYRGALRALTNS